MGKRKRSRSCSSERVRQKVSKLKRRLERYQRRLSQSSSESDKNINDTEFTGEEYLDNESLQSEYDEHNLEYGEAYLEPSPPSMSSMVQLAPTAQTAPTVQTAPSTSLAPSSALPVPPTEHVAAVISPIMESAKDISASHEADQALDPEILEILGDDPTGPQLYGENLHKDIASRWAHILTKGLLKETKSGLLKQYLPPENCSSMKTPKVNLEIKAAMSEFNIKKDLYSQSEQNQISCSLSAIGKALNWALSVKETIPQVQEIIKPLSDAARLMCDCHFRLTLSRRFALMNNLNKQNRDIVKNTTFDEFLFGSDLTEHLKTSKTILRSGLELKAYNTQRPQFKTPVTTQQVQRGTLNLRGTTRAAVGELRRNPAQRRPMAPPPPPPPPRDRRHETSRSSRPPARARSRRRY